MGSQEYDNDSAARKERQGSHQVDIRKLEGKRDTRTGQVH
ncbi:conserved hypothetical protein [delta proteobacterium NaphS2]|nr:conserved hypothetical protein [delta proteobacterium NaphS2]